MSTHPFVRLPGHGRRERGAAAIEFALIFVLFFSIMYGIVSYGIIFAVKHSLTHAVNEGARAAVKDVSGGLNGRKILAQNTAAVAVAWLGAHAPVPEVTSVNCANTGFECVTVTLAYDYAAHPIIPPLPGMGVVLPDRLAAQATVQLDAI